MAREANKTSRYRDPGLSARLFSGRVLDIGCGDDLVVPHAQPFDLPQGDCARILDYLGGQSFDCVHSSHCLEHMAEVPGVLRQWWQLVRRGGYLVLVVPDEDLYEQGVWPSLFNNDHKATFRLGGPPGSPVSFDLGQLLRDLPEAEILDIRVQDQGYRHELRRPIGQWGQALYRFGMWRSALMRRVLGAGGFVAGLDRTLFALERRLGQPIDQTSGEALAQIQAVVRKRP